MTTNLPNRALAQATPVDRLRTKQAYEQGNM